MTITATCEPKRDRWGRYLLPDPTTGKERAWTRVTTFADTLDDRYNLERWKMRQASIGLAKRADLLAMVAATPSDDKSALDKLVDQAMEAAASSSGANLGTALHRFTEQLDRGESPTPPAPLDADLASYCAVTADWSWELIETIVCVPQFGLCGTFDRLGSARSELGCRIADVKTGAGIDYAMGSIAVQLACYAHASHWWDGFGWQPMRVDIDKETAIIIHLPVGKADCKLIEVDIAAGWEAAERAAWVREWRKRKDLHKTLTLAAPTAPPPAVEQPGSATTRANLLTRLSALQPDALATMAQHWPANVPTFKASDTHTDAELDAIGKVLDRVEAAHSAPFADVITQPQPTVETPKINPQLPVEGPRVELVDVQLLLKSCPDECKLQVSAWNAQATAANVPFDPRTQPTGRRFDILRAAIACARHLGDDELVRAALDTVYRVVYGAEMPDNATTGAAFGALTIAEAQRLHDIATAFGNGTVTTTVDETGVIRFAA